MASYTFSALPTATGHLFQWYFCLPSIGEWSEHTLSLEVLMVLICLKLNRGEQREMWNLKRYLDVMQGLIIVIYSSQCTDIDEQESSIITNGQKGLIYMYQFQIPIHDWIHERENYLSKDVVVTKASCDISWQVVAHKLRC